MYEQLGFMDFIAGIQKKIQEKTGKQIEALKEKTEKSLRELQKNTTKQVKK